MTLEGIIATLTLPLFAVALIVIPFIVAVRKQRSGKKVSAKKTIAVNAFSFIGTMLVMGIALPLAASAMDAQAAAETATAAAEGGISEGLKYIAAALSTGFATIGTGIAVGNAAPAAIGATSEDEKNFTKSLIFVALGEGVAIYGLLISILILFS